MYITDNLIFCRSWSRYSINCFVILELPTLTLTNDSFSLALSVIMAVLQTSIFPEFQTWDLLSPFYRVRIPVFLIFEKEPSFVDNLKSRRRIVFLFALNLRQQKNSNTKPPTSHSQEFALLKATWSELQKSGKALASSTNLWTILTFCYYLASVQIFATQICWF